MKKWCHFTWLFCLWIVKICPVHLQMSVSRTSCVGYLSSESYNPFLPLLMDLLCNFWLFLLGLGRIFLQTCIGLQWLLGLKIDMLVLFMLSFIKCPFLLVGSYWIYSLWPCILWYELMLWWVQVLCVYPPLEMMNWFFAPPLVVKECPPLVVLDNLLSVTPL